jgi:hypothetical protein
VADIFSKRLYTVTYLLICFIIAIPFNYANLKLLYTEDGIPSGADSTFHTYSILKILDTGEPLIRYSAFPSLITNTSSYYPSLMHLTIASIAKIAANNQASTYDPYFVIEVEKSFMLVVSLAGTAGYALLIRTLIVKLINDKINGDLRPLHDPKYHTIYLVISVLAFGIFINSISPIVRNYNDGTYGEIFAMWLVFPYYMFFLTNKRWITSSFLLAIIASAHNIALLMSLSATVPYIGSLLFQRIKGLKINLIKFVIIFIIFGSAALILFYFPVITSVLQGGGGDALYLRWSKEIVVEQITPGLYYAGIVSIAAGLILNYRVLGWISAWALIYFIVFDLSSILGARFARELSIIFGLAVGICIGYVLFMSVLTGKKFLNRGRLEFNNISISFSRLILIVTISATLIPISYLYFEDYLHAASNPNTTTKYFTVTVDQSNKFFLTLLNEGNNDTSVNDKRVIALFGDNPWLKVTTYGKFEVLTVHPGGTQNLGKLAKPINDELDQILTSPDIRSTACVIKKYDIDYIYISDRIPGKWYSPHKGDVYYKQLSLFQDFAHSPFFDLKAEFIRQEGEHIRIFSVMNEDVNRACN